MDEAGDTMTTKNAIGPHWVKYGGQYLAALVLVTIAYAIFNEFVGDVSGASMVAPVIALLFPIGTFVKEHRRILTSGERWQLLGLCYAIFVVSQIILVGLAAALGGFSMILFGEVPGLTVLIVWVGVMALEFALMWLMLRFFPQRSLRGLLKAEERKAARARSNS